MSCRTALHLAARAGAEDMLHVLLDDMEEAERKEYVNEADKNGITPVYLARQKGKLSALYLSGCVVACMAHVCMSLRPAWQRLLTNVAHKRRSRASRRLVQHGAAASVACLYAITLSMGAMQPAWHPASCLCLAR